MDKWEACDEEEELKKEHVYGGEKMMNLRLPETVETPQVEISMQVDQAGDVEIFANDVSLGWILQRGILVMRSSEKNAHTLKSMGFQLGPNGLSVKCISDATYVTG